MRKEEGEKTKLGMNIDYAAENVILPSAHKNKCLYTNILYYRHVPLINVLNYRHVPLINMNY